MKLGGMVFFLSVFILSNSSLSAMIVSSEGKEEALGHPEIKKTLFEAFEHMERNCTPPIGPFGS